MLYYGLVIVATAGIMLVFYNLIVIKWCADHRSRRRTTRHHDLPQVWVWSPVLSTRMMGVVIMIVRLFISVWRRWVSEETTQVQPLFSCSLYRHMALLSLGLSPLPFTRPVTTRTSSDEPPATHDYSAIWAFSQNIVRLNYFCLKHCIRSLTSRHRQWCSNHLHYFTSSLRTLYKHYTTNIVHIHIWFTDQRRISHFRRHMCVGFTNISFLELG